MVVQMTFANLANKNLIVVRQGDTADPGKINGCAESWSCWELLFKFDHATDVTGSGVHEV